jgi:hypothetical protein
MLLPGVRLEEELHGKVQRLAGGGPSGKFRTIENGILPQPCTGRMKNASGISLCFGGTGGNLPQFGS